MPFCIDHINQCGHIIAPISRGNRMGEIVFAAAPWGSSSAHQGRIGDIPDVLGAVFQRKLMRIGITAHQIFHECLKEPV